MTYDYCEDFYQTSQSELTGAVGQHSFNFNQIPGAYQPDWLIQNINGPNDALPTVT
jgi:hypothetical protein